MAPTWACIGTWACVVVCTCEGACACEDTCAWCVAAWAWEAGWRTVRAVVQGVSALRGEEQGATTRLSRGATLSFEVQWVGGEAGVCWSA